MEQKLNQRIAGYYMPNYICDILINDYTQNFLRMAITKKESQYLFTYDLTAFDRCMANKLPSCQKFLLLESLYEMNQINEDHLIPSQKYLLEPELIYWRNSDTSRKNIRMLFYPDIKEIPFMKKWLRMVEDILDPDIIAERNLLLEMRTLLKQGNNPDQLKHLVESSRKRSLEGEWVRNR